MLDKNDRKYIIRRIITYIAIAMIMLLFNTLKAKAVTYSQGVTFSSYGQWGQRETQTKFFNGNNTLLEYHYTISPSYQVLCDTEQCLVEFYYNGVCSEYHINNNQTSTSNTSFQVIANSAQLTTGNYPMCSVTSSGIQCIVNNGNRISELTLYSNTTDFSSQGINSAKCTFTLHDRINIYNLSGDVATAINQNTQAVNEVNNSINDDSGVSNNDVSGGASDWASNNATSGAINQLVLMPITLLQSFTNGINGACQTYDFGELWGTHITLPCINLSTTLGSVWTIVDIIMSGIFIFIFGKRCVKIFNDFTNLKSGQIDSLYGGGN